MARNQKIKTNIKDRTPLISLKDYKNNTNDYWEKVENHYKIKTILREIQKILINQELLNKTKYERVL